jgi:hypothetical protein
LRREGRGVLPPSKKKKKLRRRQCRRGKEKQRVGEEKEAKARSLKKELNIKVFDEANLNMVSRMSIK